MFDVSAFTSSQIKLAALIISRRQLRGSPTNNKQRLSSLNRSKKLAVFLLAFLSTTLSQLASEAQAAAGNHQQLLRGSREHRAQLLPRDQTHLLNIVPSSHFLYTEGRQTNHRDSPEEAQQLEAARAAPQDHSHIYKRSSALVMAAGSNSYTPLISSSSQHSNQLVNSPLRRRMMSEGAQSRWTAPQMEGHEKQPRLLSQPTSASGPEGLEELEAEPARQSPAPGGNKVKEAELLRQKQHIQYHDQWPSMAGKCHKRTLNFCASVLPFNTTTFPNIIGDTNRFEVKRSLPFFGFLAKSSCNKRLDELLCLLLEPPCAPASGQAIPPCKKFCRLALEGCNEYIPATLAMSSVFDCRQYPDSNDPSVCINLAQGNACAADEFKCPDKTCIPHNWLCDGVRDCVFAADEANCTAVAGSGQQTSVCSTEEFKCDGKCVPKAWKCDGERDCLDGTDEEACELRPRCGPDRFKCADGNGCIPKRWVCDGKAECRDGSDEINCEQRQCSENDFKCDNGICIPKLWRCDRQFDCKDGSDERSCVYQPSSTQAPTTVQPEGSGQPANGTEPSPQQVIDRQEQPPALEEEKPAGEGELGKQTSAIAEDVSRIIQQDQQQQQQVVEREEKEGSPPALLMGDLQRGALSQKAELKKFDYDIIQSAASSPPPAGQSEQPSAAEPQQQPAGQLDFRLAERKPAEELQRLRALQQQERPPIYRSLFKSLNRAGGSRAQPVAESGQGQFRYAVGGGRRLRERKQQPSSQSEPDELSRLSSAVADSPAAPEVAPASSDRRQQVQLPVAQRAHSVASYLQLLNSRYNLRLPRVVSGAPAAKQP